MLELSKDSFERISRFINDPWTCSIDTDPEFMCQRFKEMFRKLVPYDDNVYFLVTRAVKNECGRVYYELRLGLRINGCVLGDVSRIICFQDVAEFFLYQKLRDDTGVISVKIRIAEVYNERMDSKEVR